MGKRRFCKREKTEAAVRKGKEEQEMPTKFRTLESLGSKVLVPE